MLFSVLGFYIYQYRMPLLFYLNKYKMRRCGEIFDLKQWSPGFWQAVCLSWGNRTTERIFITRPHIAQIQYCSRYEKLGNYLGSLPCSRS